MREEDWRLFGRCQGENPDWWFPATLEEERSETHRMAKQLCRECPAQKGCLDYALEHNIIYGTWGGFSERERRKNARRLKAARGTKSRTVSI